MVFGHGLDQPMALVVLAESALSLPGERVVALLTGHLQTINAGHARFEQVGRVGYCRQPWTPQNGLTTPTLKIRRAALEEKFRPAMLASKEAVVSLD